MITARNYLEVYPFERWNAKVNKNFILNIELKSDFGAIDHLNKIQNLHFPFFPRCILLQLFCFDSSGYSSFQ